MKKDLQINADRFMGFADVYNNARPNLLLVNTYVGTLKKPSNYARL